MEIQAAGTGKKLELQRSKVVNAKYPLSKIESGSIVLYFGTENGDTNPVMESLDKKYYIIPNYKKSQKILGNVIRTEKFNDIIYGCIVKKKNEDLFNFAYFEKCLKEIKKRNKKDQYMYVAIEAIRDEDLLLEKITNIIRTILYDLELYICWPEELQYYMPDSFKMSAY